MDEDTTTDQTVAQTGADEAQPVQATETETADVQTDAVPSDESTDDETATQSESESTVDDKLKRYAESQGFELDSPNAIKAAKAALKAQSEATRNHQKASELEKTLRPLSDEYAENEAIQTNTDPDLLKTVRGMQVKEAVRDFWAQDGIDKAYEPKMIELLAEKPHLAGDLESLYATAVMKSGTIAATKTEGGKSALKKLAAAQQAAVPTGNATNAGTTPKSKPFAELSQAEMEAKLGFVRR